VWAAAAVYNVTLAGAPPPAADVRLVIDWTGDVARLYDSPAPDAPLSALLGDAFFNSPAETAALWSVSLSRATPPGAPLPAALTLRVLPLRADASAYVALDSWPAFGTGPGGSALAVTSVDVVCALTVELDVEA
jgi:hypothetical protein